jgi:hypothetical protein
MKGGGQPVRGPAPPQVVPARKYGPLEKLSDEEVRIAVEPQNITGRISHEYSSKCLTGRVEDYEDRATYIPLDLILNDRLVKEHVWRLGKSGHEMEFLFGTTRPKAGVVKGGVFKGWILHLAGRQKKLCVMAMPLGAGKLAKKVSLAEYESKKAPKAPKAPKARVIAGKGIPTEKAAKKYKSKI